MGNAVDPDTTEYREHLSNVTSRGKRVWVYPKILKGLYYRWRIKLSALYLVVFFALPFIKINGHAFMLLNVLERKFILFGIPFWPQDFSILVFVMLTFFVFIMLFTVIYGRVFCGWGCPQTVFLEMVFRRMEQWIEGIPSEMRKRDAGPWNRDKWVRKIAKHSLFFITSFLIANTFLAYLIGMDDLLKIVVDNPLNHLKGLVAILGFTLAFYAVFAHLRELVCIMICPYGRMQSVLVDPNTIMVNYDHKRGEPREMIRKNQERKGGDCIDCKLCVQVCPTGIDIRNGLQLECVNCTACIDACNSVMTKINKPLGLIRYDSSKAIQEGTPFRWTTRIKAYSAVLVLLLGILVFLLATRPDLETTVLRSPGTMYQQNDKHQITNLFNMELVNKTFHSLDFTLRTTNPEITIQWVAPLTTVKGGSLVKGTFFLAMNPMAIHQISTPVELEVINANGVVVDRLKTNFVGPVNTKKP